MRIATSLTAQQLDLHATCTAALEAVEQLFDARASWILLHEPTAGRLVTEAFRGLGAEYFAGLRIASRCGIGGLASSSRRMLFVPSVQEETRWLDPARMHASGLCAVCTVPMACDGRAIGVLGFDSPRFSASHPPTPGDSTCMEALAAHAAVAIDNARRFQTVEVDRLRLEGLIDEHGSAPATPLQAQQAAEPAGTAVLPDVVGDSEGWRAVIRDVDLVANTDTTVLLLGETGTREELIAKLVHARSPRHAQPFVIVNCAAMPDTLVESELFGYEKGAFTGADNRKPGSFEMADGGTLFLDEIGDLPLCAQAKLLRVLQERVVRLGATRPRRLNVRLIAATNQDLELRRLDGRFRADLYYRVAVFPITVPPLRERREDIPALACLFVRQIARRLGSGVSRLAPGAIDRLMGYEWPGNVRELQNIIERAIVLARGSVIEPELVAIGPAAAAALGETERQRFEQPASSPWTEPLRDVVGHAIRLALRATGWRVSGRGGAAELLGLKPTTLHAKMKKLGIQRTAAMDGTELAPARGGRRSASRAGAYVLPDVRD